MKNPLLILLLTFTIATAYSQEIPIDEATIQKELDARGLQEEDVRRKLEERGIDIDNIDASQLPELQSTLEEVVRELEMEKEAQENGQTTPGQDASAPPGAPDLVPTEAVPDAGNQQATEEIEQAIEEESIEEQIAEQIIEESIPELPSSNIYGQQIFRDKSLEVFTRSLDIRPSPSYVLGPGDKVNVSIWGISQEDATYEINKEGYIKPTAMSRIQLKGLTYAQAKELLRKRFGLYYRFRSEEFAVTISHARTLTVNIYGEVPNPGGFTLPATNTAFNALVAAGGPTDIGSVRNIRLIRDGEEPRVIDVYEFMNDPSVKNDYYLQDNDVILVDLARKVVAINGAVKRPFRYELKGAENLIQLIEYAGGFQKNAYLDAIQLKRFENNEEKIIDVDLKALQASGSDYKLLHGDEIMVKAIPRSYQNYVEIIGSVDFPAQYEYRDGDKALDLIQKGILTENARKDVAYLLRTRDDGTVRYEKLKLSEMLDNPSGNANVPLQPKDQIMILALSTFVDINTFSIGGAVRSPKEGQFDPEENIRVEDAVLLAGGLKVDAKDEAYIIRTNLSNTTEKEYIQFNVRNAMLNPSSDDNVVLKPLDEIVIVSKESFADAAAVSVDGAVRKPGKYAYDDGLRVSDVVYFSNGLAPSATDFAIIHRPDPGNKKKKGYVRVNIREALDNPSSASNIRLQPNDQLYVFNKETYTDESIVEVQGAVRKPGSIPYDQTLTLRDALTLAGGLRREAASNRVEIFRIQLTNNQPTRTTVAVLEVDDDFTVQGDEFQLEPFDQVVVRTVPDFELQQMVTITGEVKFPGNYALLDKNERLSSIVSRAGGITTEGFPEGAILTRPSETGTIVTKLDKVIRKPGSHIDYILKPGDVIDIPKKKDLVGVKTTNTRAEEVYPEKVLAEGQINVPYHVGRRAGYYVREYAVGVGENGRKSRITVEHPNGELKRTRRFLFFNVHPRVRKGSVVSVGAKPPKKEKEQKGEREKSDTDWEKIVGNTVAQVTAVLSLVLLLQQIN